jgi:hypothetical protein
MYIQQAGADAQICARAVGRAGRAGRREGLQARPWWPDEVIEDTPYFGRAHWFTEWTCHSCCRRRGEACFDGGGIKLVKWCVALGWAARLSMLRGEMGVCTNRSECAIQAGGVPKCGDTGDHGAHFPTF